MMVVNFKQVDGNQSYLDTVCNLNGNPIENVKKFRYLGNDIQYDQSSTGDAEVDLRIAVAENKFNELFKKLTNRKINLHTRVQIMNSIVRSRLVYSCQTWNINQQQQQRIRSSYICMLRKMIRGGFEREINDNEEETFHYVLSNDEVLQICKTKDIMTHVTKQQSNYLALIARRPNTNNAKRLLFNKNINRKRGRPVKTMEQHVLKNNNMTADQFYKIARKKLETDMVGNNGRNRSMSTPVDWS